MFVDEANVHLLPYIHDMGEQESGNYIFLGRITPRNIREKALNTEREIDKFESKNLEAAEFAQYSGWSQQTLETQ